MKALREQHQLRHTGKHSNIAIGDVVLIEDDERKRGKWKMGIVYQLITARDGVVTAAKLRAENSQLERALQQLYPLELKCDRETEKMEKMRVLVPVNSPHKGRIAALR